MTKSTRMVLPICALAALLFAACGCNLWSPAKPKPLTQEAFLAPRSGNISNTATAGGSGGTVGAGEQAVPAVQIPANPPPRTTPRVAPPAPAPTVTSSVPPIAPPRASTTSPTIGARSGQYLTLGGVVAEVNGTPIYANKVISMLDSAGIISSKAKQLDPSNFRKSILDDVRRQIMELVRAELEYAAAQRSLDPDDQKMAQAATTYWRQQQITKAGGSVELAKRAALQETGTDFDEIVREQSRLELVKIYYSKKVYPKIQVTANDLREYYDRNKEKEFTDTEKVKFRLLKVDIAKTGSKDAAINKITDKYKRAKSGEDFSEMVQKENDEKMFATDKPWEMNPASFSIAKVREALTKLQSGQVSDIIEDSGAFYLVKLEERKGGRVRPFEEQKVQDEIRFKLRSEQFRKLREQEQNKLLRGAIVRQDDQMTNIALEMAMQKYAQYASAK